MAKEKAPLPAAAPANDRKKAIDTAMAQIEKMLGKTKFGELVGEFVIKPPGAPALASENDPKPAYSSAAADFAAVAKSAELI